MTVANPLSEAEEAKKILDRFVCRFDESYRLLVYHAAIPLILTPELLNYLRHQFLRGEVDWVAEVDLLLSDLFNPVGHELYAMDTAVRAYLLENIEEFFRGHGFEEKHLQKVALVLLGYIKYLAHSNSFFGAPELQAQQWAAMVYIEEQKEKVYQDIKQAFKTCVSEAELARLTQITQKLSPQLSSYPSLIKFAGSVRDLLLDLKPGLTDAELLETRASVAQLSQDLEIDLTKFPKLGIRKVQKFGLNQILLIEDEREVIEEISQVLLSQYGITVRGTDEVNEVIEQAESGQIDLILINRLLPRSRYKGRKVNGFEIVELLKSNLNISHDLPIVGFSLDYVEDEFLQYGADGFYSKRELLDSADFQKFVDYLQVVFNQVTQTKSSKPGKNYAIAIGINNYEHLPKLQYAVRDAEAMNGRFKAEDFSLINRFTAQPTLATIQGFLVSQFVQTVFSAEDTLWFFFSGHGRMEQGKDYLMLTDSITEKVTETALSLNFLVERLLHSGAGKVILFLDMDRISRNSFTESSSSFVAEAKKENQSVIIFYACYPSTGAYEVDQLQQGSLSAALLEAWQPDSVYRGQSAERLGQFLQQRVSEINSQYGRPPQVPQVIADPTSRLNLVLLPPRKLETFEFKTVFVNRQGEIISRETHSAQYFREQLETLTGNRLGVYQALDMVYIPGGTFMMGTEDEEIEGLVKKFNWEGYRRERPRHQVTVPPFFMGKYPVTQAQWKAIASRTDLKVEKDLDPDPSHFKDPPKPPLKRGASDSPPFEGGARGGSPTHWDRPVERVDWYDVVEFCARLSKLTGREYRLPSEAEWEYACRAGTTTPFYFGETITGELANYDASNTYAEEAKGEYRQQTTPVGQFPPNAFGLYDMHGNVWEWCADTWHDNYDGAPTDGSAWIENGDDNRSPPRGGSWCSNPDSCRSASRDYYFRRVNDSSFFGFRVVCGAGRTL